MTEKTAAKKTAAKPKEPDYSKWNLWQKLSAIQAEVQPVAKSGYNSFHKYAYACEADIVAGIKPLL